MANPDLRTFLACSGWTYEAVARAVRLVAAEMGDHTVRTNRATVAHWVAGTTPGDQTVRYLTEAASRRVGRTVTPQELGLPSPDRPEDAILGLTVHGDPTPVIEQLAGADMHRRTFVTGTAYSVAASILPLGLVAESADRATAAPAGYAGAADVAAVRDMARALTMLDEQYGGAHGRGALLHYLTGDVSALCRAGFRNDGHRAAMLSASAYLVHLAGWKAHDAGEQGLAQRYYLQSFRQARESGIPGHDAYVLRTMTHHALDLKHPQYVLSLANAALERARAAKVSPATEALFVITRAEALAVAGQPLAARRGIDHAHAMLAQHQGEELPFWATSWGPIAPNLQSRTAKTYKALGDHDAAEKAFAASAAGRAGFTWARIHSLELAWQAETQCAGGRIEEACATWNRSLDAMTGVRSTRTRKAVTGMRQALSPFRQRGSRAAAELYERGGLLLRDAA